MPAKVQVLRVGPEDEDDDDVKSKERQWIRQAMATTMLQSGCTRQLWALFRRHSGTMATKSVTKERYQDEETNSSSRKRREGARSPGKSLPARHDTHLLDELGRE